MDNKKLEQLSADHERWDNRELGASAEHVGIVSDKEEKEIDDGLGLQAISIRLHKPQIEQLKGLAKLEGIGYQPLIRQVLAKYIQENEHKLDLLLSAAEAAARAEKLFAQAVRLREQIPTMTPLSNERIFAECDYTQALSQSQGLFVQAFDATNDAILKQHVNMRVGQIAELCQQELQASHDKKYGKKAQPA